MEYSEYPGVEEGFDRKLIFEQIKWYSKEKFEKTVLECLKLDKPVQIYPCLNENLPINKRVFVGKTIPKAPPLNRLANSVTNNLNHLGSTSFDYLELIGNVINVDEKKNKWCLRVTHDGEVYDVLDDFLVLYINDPNSFFWSPNYTEKTYFKIPRYSLRGAIDKIDCKYSFIGRTYNEFETEKRPKYYSNTWFNFDENMLQTFGKVNKAYRLLFAPYKNIELGFDNFEILCLKASPAPLKVLCRTAIRAHLDYSQKKIKALNSLTVRLPETLISYLKYPSFLKVGEYMLRDEKLVKEDDDYELVIEKSTGNLICKSLNSDNRERLLAYNIDFIWLHKFQTVFYNNINSTVFTAYSIYDNLSPYTFFIKWNKLDLDIKTY
jgi:hypothetical protein